LELSTAVQRRAAEATAEQPEDAPPAPSSSPWMTVAQAARYAAVSTDLIYLACERNELRHVRIGGRRSIRLKRDWLDQWLEQHTRGATAPTATGHSDRDETPLRATTEAGSPSGSSQPRPAPQR
jgi:excisionase family DNA binding protein